MVTWFFSRYTRVKQDNAALTARIHMLEEHIRELEVLCFKMVQFITPPIIISIPF